MSNIIAHPNYLISPTFQYIFSKFPNFSIFLISLTIVTTSYYYHFILTHDACKYPKFPVQLQKLVGHSTISADFISNTMCGLRRSLSCIRCSVIVTGEEFVSCGEGFNPHLTFRSFSPCEVSTCASEKIFAPVRCHIMA